MWLPSGSQAGHAYLSSSAGEHDDGHVPIGARREPEAPVRRCGVLLSGCGRSATGLADLLASGPRSITDLAAATGADAQSVYRVLRALASRELFREDGDRRFALTPLADPLRQDATHSIRPHCGAVVRPTDAPGANWSTASEPVNLPSMSMANRSLTTLPRTEHLRRSSTT